jgi:hypothetical protein
LSKIEKIVIITLTPVCTTFHVPGEEEEMSEDDEEEEEGIQDTHGDEEQNRSRSGSRSRSRSGSRSKSRYIYLPLSGFY